MSSIAITGGLPDFGATFRDIARASAVPQMVGLARAFEAQQLQTKQAMERALGIQAQSEQLARSLAAATLPALRLSEQLAGMQLVPQLFAAETLKLNFQLERLNVGKSIADHLRLADFSAVLPRLDVDTAWMAGLFPALPKTFLDEALEAGPRIAREAVDLLVDEVPVELSPEMEAALQEAADAVWHVGLEDRLSRLPAATLRMLLVAIASSPILITYMTLVPDPAFDPFSLLVTIALGLVLAAWPGDDAAEDWDGED
ncbi:MAG: hypothetical protein LCI03_16715 [Actinobacteria bacterium]|nr:hypothetical protein [Actinomycetota bacterium]